MQLDGKAALVTGAGGGLGGATARRFAAEGASVLCTDRDLARAERTVADIELAGGTAVAFEADIADPAQCEVQVAETVARFGKIDILVNNAGISMHKLALETTLEEWNRVLGINLTGSWLPAQAGELLQMMMQRCASGVQGALGSVLLGAAGEEEEEATELSGQGVMVNASAPGPIETGLSHHGPTRKRAYTDRIPVGDYGTVEAGANAALFFASDECLWTTGTVHNVDGGYGAQGASYDPQEISG